MRRLWLAALVVLWAAPLFAAHPRAIMTGDIITRIRAKEAASSADWLALKAECDSHIQYTALTGDNLPPVFQPREPLSTSIPGYIWASYQGLGYEWGVEAAVCYYATAVADPTTAAKYKAQALKTLIAASAPMAILTTPAPPANWQGHTSRGIYYVDGNGPGGQARVYLTKNYMSTGDTVTISGVLGCTDANITGKVGATSTFYFDLLDSGDSPVTCSSAGLNYNQNFGSDAGYGFRSYGVFLGLLYDWFYDDLSAQEKTNIYNTVNFGKSEFNIVSPGYTGGTMSNYHAGYFSSFGISAILTQGVGENPLGDARYDEWRNTVYELQDQPFFDRWLGNNAGFPEAIRYQSFSANNIALTLLTQWEANGENLMATDFPWVLDLMEYWVHNTMPPRTYMSLRGFIPSPADATGTTPNPWKDLSPTMWIVHHLADLMSDPFRPKFKDYVEDLEAQNGLSDKSPWWRVLWWDPSLGASDWTVETPSLPQMSNPDGGWMRTNMRSDWTTDAVYGDIWSGPAISQAGNAKERYDKGSFHVQRGDVHLLVSATAESTRAGNTTAYNAFHGDRYDPYGVYWPYLLPSGPKVRQQKYWKATYDQPGWTDNYPTTVVLQNPARVDRYEDATSYVYSRSVQLNEVYTWNGANKPAQGWDREILYLRPKVFVVYDRTRTVEQAPYTYNQFISWITAKTPVVSSYGVGMYRTEVSDGGTYKGALTHVLPASMPEPTNTDMKGYGITYEVSAYPPVNTESVNWMTVVDAADAQGNLEDVVRFATSSNVDVIRLGTGTVVGFPDRTVDAVVALPMTYTMSGVSGTVTHRIAGLTASTTYNVTESGNDITVASSGGGADVGSTAAGVLVFTSGSGGTPVVTVSTTSLPDGTLDVAYSETLGATGGTGGPYDWTVTAGAVPSNTSLSSGGVLSGTPDTAETANFTAQACDTTPTCGDKALSVVINAATLTITTAGLPNALKDVAYTSPLVATGGTPPYVWDTSAGVMCSGLALSASGVVSGIPTAGETCHFTARVTDDASDTDTQALSITVAPSELTLRVKVEPGSVSAVIHIGTRGLPYDTTCTVELRDGNILVASVETTSGKARRSSGFAGLSEETPYGVTADCSEATATTVVSFTTKPADPPSALFSTALKPPSILATVEKVKVGYKLLPAGGTVYTADTACASGCAVETTLTSGGTYELSHVWLTSGGDTVATSRPRYYAVP